MTAIVGALQHRFEAQNNVVQAAYKAGALINGPHSPTESDYAVFGDLIVPIADGLRGELGARQSWDIKHDKGILSGQAADLNSSNFPAFTNFSWKVGLEYDVRQKRAGLRQCSDRLSPRRLPDSKRLLCSATSAWAGAMPRRRSPLTRLA